ncbi:hypothetical protein HY439_03805 [Candidatus Microgenomates bacterium]|nr:hypothetical protein [Candidatus Microgenomates bacterium]
MLNLPQKQGKKQLIPTKKLIDLCKERGINLGTGDPNNRIRYWTKIGLLPHAIRKSATEHTQTPANLLTTEGHYPIETLELLQKINKLHQQGKPSLEIKEILSKKNKNNKFYLRLSRFLFLHTLIFFLTATIIVLSISYILSFKENSGYIKSSSSDQVLNASPSDSGFLAFGKEALEVILRPVGSLFTFLAENDLPVPENTISEINPSKNEEGKTLSSDDQNEPLSDSPTFNNLTLTGNFSGGNIQTAGKNLIANSSFEAGEGEPKLWYYIDQSTTNNTRASQESVRTGNLGLKITSVGQATYLGIGQPITLTRWGTAYTLSAYVRGNKVKGENIRLGFWDKEKQQRVIVKEISISSLYSDPYNTASFDWTRIQATMDNSNQPVGKNYFPIIEVWGLTAGTLYFDDIQLEEGTTTTIYKQDNTSVGEGSLITDSSGNIYPRLTGQGSLGLSGQSFSSLYLDKASITSGGDLTIQGNGTFKNDLTVDGNLALKKQLTMTALSSAPDASTGRIYYNSSTNKMYYYDGSSWVDMSGGDIAQLWTDGGTITYLASTTDDLAIGGTNSSASFFMDVSTGNLTLTGDLSLAGGDLTTSATTWNFDVGNGGTLYFRDGSNNLMTLADNGSTGTLTVNTITPSTINAFTLGGAITGNSQNITGIGTLGATTVNAFAAGGNIDMSNYIISNLGNAGTDFDTSGGLTLAGDLTANGNTTIGNASGDTLTINAATLSLANASTLNLANSSTTSLNIESGLMDFDTSNSRIGIGTTAPASILEVSASSSQPTLTISYNSDPGTSNAFASLNLRSQDTSSTPWTLAYDTPATGIVEFEFDAVNGVMYTGGSGSVYRCPVSSGCNEASDWNSYTNDATSDLTIDTTNSVLYGAGGGTIYRCELSTGCDAAGDWTTSYATPESSINSMVFDSANGVIYAGTRTNGIIYRCATSTDCDAAGDWTTAYDTSESRIYTLEIDTANSILYAGTCCGGVIYRCALSTGCDAAGDWTTSYDTSGADVFDLSIDSTNSVIYAGTSGDGIIYRCATSTGCDAAEDWTTSYDTSSSGIYSLIVDTTNAALYAGSGGGDGIIYRCATSTGCDAAGDWTTSYDTSEADIWDFGFDSTNGVVYAGTLSSGYIFRNSGSFEPTLTTYGQIQGLASDTTDLSEDGSLIFKTMQAASLTEAMRIAGANIGINDSTPDAKLDIDSTATSGTDFGITNTGVMAGNIVGITADSLTTGTGIDLSLDGITTGKGINLTSTSNAIDSATLLGITVNPSAATDTSLSADIANLAFSPTYSTAITTPTVSGNVLDVSRSVTTNSSFASTLTLSGALASFSDSATQTTGTLTSTADVVQVLQNYTSNSGSALNITTASTNTSSYALRVNDDGTLSDPTPFVINYAGNVGIGTTTPSGLLNIFSSTSGWITSNDTSESRVSALAFDSTNDVIYAGTYSSSIIYRCATSTGCDAAEDWTTSYDTSDDRILDLVLDTTNNVLYAGTGSNGIIYRCATSTSCDAAEDWTTSYDTSETHITTLVLDTTNNVLYAGSGNSGIIYRCATSTGCDAAGDWTTAYDTSETIVRSFAFDSANGVIYAGTGENGIIYRCATSTGCDDGATDWTTAYDTSETYILRLIFDSSDGVIYAGTGENGIIYRCNTSSSCDAAGDWTTAYDTSEQRIWSFALDTTNKVLYAGSETGGIIYRHATPQFMLSNNTTTAYAELNIDSAGQLGFFPANGTLFSGTSTFNSNAIINGNLGIGTASPTYKVDISASDSPLRVLEDDANTNDIQSLIVIARTSSGTTTAGFGSHLRFDLEDGAGNTDFAGAIGTVWEDATSGSEDAALIFQTMGSNGTALAEKMRLNSSGNVGIGTTSPAAKLTVVGAGCFDTAEGGVKCGSAGTAGDIYYGSAHANWTDIAEKYPSKENLEAAEVVSLDLENSIYVKRSRITYDPLLLGVVSTQPGMTLGDDYGRSQDYSIAIIGRVPVKVSLENGPVQIGDPLTSSSLPGIAMKATQAGPIIGRALEAFDDLENLNQEVEIFTANGENYTVGRVMIFVNTGWWSPSASPATQTQTETSNTFMIYDEETLSLAGDLTVLGKTSLAQTTISGMLSQDGSLVLQNGNQIDALYNTLYLQKLGTGGLDILDGKLKVDKDGNVEIAKDLEIKGNLTLEGKVLGSKDLRGINVTIPSGSSQLRITLEEKRESPNFAVSVSPSWNTTIWITEKKEDGFTINFGAPANEDASLDWIIID